MRSIIVGTAGHIDHGKSSIVAALTGKDPDRLPEEKRRGITIELGFADLRLGDFQIGFVDVPGHERFIKNMLAGAHGIDVVALVIAADEGVMPQTREHFDICRLLGIEKGVVIISKADLVEAELLELVHEEARELIKDSFLADAPVVSVSAKTGQGLAELKEVLQRVGSEVPSRPSDYLARLPVDRVFTMKGFGAVVTGTLVAGEIREGDELDLLPGGKRVRARGLQVHGQAVKAATAGNRTAVNLGGIESAAIERGMVIAASGKFLPSQVIDVSITVLPDAPRPVRNRARIRLHAHAAEVLGRVRVLDESGIIEPGKPGFAQLRLESPVVLVAGDRFVLRSYSPSQTIAGGEVLDPFATKHRGREFATVRERLEKLRLPSQRVATFVSSTGDVGLRMQELAARTAWNDEALGRALGEAKQRAEIIDCEGVFLATEKLRLLEKRVIEEVKRHHQREPLARGLARETLRERLFTRRQPEVFRTVLNNLQGRNVIVIDRDLVRLADHKLAVSHEDTAFKNALARVYREARLEPPNLDEAFAKAGFAKNQHAYARKLLQLLIDSGELVRIQPDLFFERTAIEELRAKLLDYAATHEPERAIDVATFKTLAGLSRKYAIPLLEYFDRERITRRDGDRRVILK